jgi:hypothetical protein
VQVIRAASFVTDGKLSTEKRSAQPLALDRGHQLSAASDSDSASTRQRHDDTSRTPHENRRHSAAGSRHHPNTRCAVHLQHTAQHTHRTRSDGGAHIKAVAA